MYLSGWSIAVLFFFFVMIGLLGGAVYQFVLGRLSEGGVTFVSGLLTGGVVTGLNQGRKKAKDEEQSNYEEVKKVCVDISGVHDIRAKGRKFRLVAYGVEALMVAIFTVFLVIANSFIVELALFVPLLLSIALISLFRGLGPRGPM
jgi:hypothetical protein